MTLLAPVSPYAQLSFVPLRPTTSRRNDTKVEQGSALLASISLPRHNTSKTVENNGQPTVDKNQEGRPPHFHFLDTKMPNSLLGLRVPLGMWQGDSGVASEEIRPQ